MVIELDTGTFVLKSSNIDDSISTLRERFDGTFIQVLLDTSHDLAHLLTEPANSHAKMIGKRFFYKDNEFDVLVHNCNWSLVKDLLQCH